MEVPEEPKHIYETPSRWAGLDCCKKKRTQQTDTTSDTSSNKETNDSESDVSSDVNLDELEFTSNTTPSQLEQRLKQDPS